MSGARERWMLMGVLVALGVGWGSTQSLGKIAASGGAGPMALVFWQLLIGSVVLGAIALSRGQRLLFTPPALRFYVIIAVLGTVAPAASFYASIARLPAGVMSIIMATVPMIAFPLGLFLGAEVFSRRRFAGLLLGLAGVLLIALPSTALPDPAMAAFLPVALIAPVFYALEGLYVARAGTAGMDAVTAMFGASVAGALMALPIMLALGQGFVPNSFGLPEASMLFMSALHALLYAAFIWLAAHAGAVYATQTSYIITASGMIWAVIILGERFSPLVILAACVMLGGMALVQPALRKDRVIAT
jgi:drug/metabolite transporter (DMT)-like permease